MKFFSTVITSLYFRWLECWLKVRYGLIFVAPNYAFYRKFQSGDCAIDVGVGNDPDFSLYLTKKYGMHVFMIDPTLKHRQILKKYENSNPLLHYLQYAIGHSDAVTTFYESKVNVSGSLKSTHRNIVDDPVITYPVNVLSLDSLLKLINQDKIKIIKIDIEGEEYQLIEKLTESVVKKFDQIIIEFHHDTVSEYTMEDTLKAIKKITSFGMKSIHYNGRDCLFFWKNTN